MPLAFSLLIGAMISTTGEGPSVTRFARGKTCAISMEFDDSMTTQVKNVLPLLKKFKFPATFFINPGRPQYQAVRDVWEREVPADGHELANHTVHHGDTVGAQKAEEEIAPVAKLIEKVLGHKHLTMFGIPGGVKWDIPKADFERILKENRLISPGRQDFFQDGQGDITRFPKRALDNGIWRQLGFHGVGGEWLSTSVENLTTLLQYLDKHRNEIWVAPTGTVWKYVHERDALVKIESSGHTYRPKFDWSNLAYPDLCDVPLTMKVSVPADWTEVRVNEDGKSHLANAANGTLLFDFSPHAKVIRLSKG